MSLPPLARVDTAVVTRNKKGPRASSNVTDRHRMRRVSNLVMPNTGKCTMLPELSSIDALLQSFGDNIEEKQKKIEILKAEQTMADTAGLQDVGCGGVAAEISSQAWHLVLLGRTFRELSVQQAAQCLGEVLGISSVEAFTKAHNAKKSTTFVISTYKDCKQTSEQAQRLRSKGLLVQVLSEVGLPGSVAPVAPVVPFSPAAVPSPIAPVPPATPKTRPPATPRRRMSYSDVFQETTADMTPTWGAVCGKCEKAVGSGLMEKTPKTPRRQNPRLSQLDSDRSTPRQASNDGSHAMSLPRLQQPSDSVQAQVPSKVVSEPSLQRNQDAVVVVRPRGSAIAVEGDSVTAQVPAIVADGSLTRDRRGTSMVGGEIVVARSPSKDKKARGLEPLNSPSAASISTDPDGQVVTPTSAANAAAAFEKRASSSEVNVEPLAPQCAVSASRREASALLRFAIFGQIPAEPFREDALGTKDQARLLASFWGTFDTDRSGRVDLVEFRHGLEPRLRREFSQLSPERERVLPAWAKMTPSEKAAAEFPKFIVRLRDRIAAHLFNKKVSFSLDHLIQLLWPYGTQMDLATMEAWFSEITQGGAMKRVKTPPVLARGAYQDLCAVFKHERDDLEQNAVSFDKLALLGLIDKENQQQTRQDWDKKKVGRLDMSTFVEMMCPSGFRATVQSKVGTGEDGSRVLFDSSMGHWLLERR